MKILFVVGMASIVGLAAAATAQQSQPGGAELRACRAEMDGADRLKCYDRILDELYGIDEKLVAKREEFRRGRFGLPVDDGGMRLTELEASVTGVDENLRRGGVILALDNGQAWQLLADGGLRVTYRPGMKVVISEGRLGGYRLRVPEKTGFRGVARLR